MEAREYIEVLFGEPRKQQSKLVELMAPYIKELDKKGLEIGKAGTVIEEIKGIKVQVIHVEDTFPGFGFFPNPGRAVSLLHDDFKMKKGNEKAITVGVLGTAIIFRATDAANFSVHDIADFLKKKLPLAFIEGGGHKNAGAVSFIPKMKDEVLKEIKAYIGR
jgi:RecJ-like exonuclease